MSNALFLVILSLLIAAFFHWAFRRLPQEQWQILAAVPMGKTESGDWRGMNLTYYGFFVATANVFGFLMLILLLGGIGYPLLAIFALGAAFFAICWPAARSIAAIVEKKAYTFTIGGASFVGALAAPFLIRAVNATFGIEFSILPIFAAAVTAYAYAEGFGRLACISFGCCYGKRVESLSPRFQRIFDSLHFTFTGATKKVAYEGGLEGVRVVPIQAITAIMLTAIGLIGTLLYLQRRFAAALVFTTAATQLWRFFSELFRSDLRGKAEKISAYQVMSLLLVFYSIGIVFVLPAGTAPVVQIGAGLRALWDPLALLFIQASWLAVFLYTGRSLVTGAQLSFFVHRDRI
jgi:hypothetical protein